MKKLNHILQWDNFYLEGFAIVLFLLSLFHTWLFVGMALYVYWQRRVIKYPVLLVALFLLVIRFYAFELKEIPKQIRQEVKIVQIQSYTYSDLVTIKSSGQKYQFNSAIDKYQVGDILYIDAAVSEYRGQTIPFGFNLKTYKLSRNIRGHLDVNQISKVGEFYSIYELREQLDKKLSSYENSNYLKAFILGENSFSSEQKTVYRDLGILFLFTISGLHIYAFLVVIKKIFFYLSLPMVTQKVLTYLILGVFLYLNAFSISVMRIFLMFLLYDLSKKCQLGFSKLDNIHFVFLLMLMINIHWIYHLGLIITYLILVFLFLMMFHYQGLVGYFKRLIITLIIFAVLLPFTLKVSPLMVLLLPVIVLVLTGPLFLLSIAIVMVPELEFVFNIAIDYFEGIMKFIQTRNETLFLPALSFPFLVLYYLLLIHVFKARELIILVKRLLLIVLLFSFFVFDHQVQQTTKLYMIDVGQGDSFLLQSPTCVILIDSYKHTLPLLNDLGIYHLDYLILTHADNDHIKEAESIVNNISIGYVVLNPYDEYPDYNASIIRAKTDDKIMCGEYELFFFGPIRKYDSKNDNSLVFQILIGSKTFLFTGDIEFLAEMELVEKYQYRLKSDVLKVSHHGSSTSTHKIFLDNVDPEISLISASDDNRFGFPNQDVISRLMANQITIYRTDLMGTVVYKYQSNKEKWEFYLPF